MALDITAIDVADRIPVPVTEEQLAFIEVRVQDSIDLIREAFLRRGRDFDRELETVPWLRLAATRVVREMVAAAVVVGAHAGVRSVSSTTGPQADSVTYTDAGQMVRFSGVALTDDLLAELGLYPRGARGRFPRPIRWPERVLRGRP